MPAVATRADALRIKESGTEVRSLTPLGTIPGVFIEHVSGNNGKGTGYLRSESTNRLRWKAPGSSTFGAAVAALADGSYIVEDGDDEDKFVRVQVTTSHFVSGSAEQRVLLDYVYNNAVSYTDIAAADADDTLQQPYSFEIVNDSAETLRNVRFWTDGNASIAISEDGIIFIVPSDDEMTGLLWGEIAPGASKTVYVRRLVGVPVTPLGPDPLVLTEFRYAFDG